MSDQTRRVFMGLGLRLRGAEQKEVQAVSPTRRFGNELIPYPLAQAFLPRHQAARILAEDPPGDILGPHG